MTGQRPLQNVNVADQVKDITSFDPGLGAYSFNSLSDAVRFADLMSSAGEMLPEHLRGKPALCLAVTMRALHWGFDPFALATETYQAKQGGVIGYQAKVFSAALRQCAGISLRYEFQGAVKMLDEPVRSARGNEIARRKAVGDRRCRAWAEVAGEVFEYETPALDDITIKNSPQWHNDPDQQLAYYAARGWARRHRPDVMMGAFSNDEVDEMRPMRDVTPRRGGLAQLAAKARGEEEADSSGQQGVETEPAAPSASPYELGREAGADADAARGDCPYTEDPDAASEWFRGFDEVREAVE